MSLVIVSVVWGNQVIKVDLNTKRKTSHLKQILVKEHGLDRKYRLLFRGQELEERPLADQGKFSRCPSLDVSSRQHPTWSIHLP